MNMNLFPAPSLSSQCPLVDQGFDFLVCSLAFLVGFQNDPEDLSQLQAGSWHNLANGIRSGRVLCQLLQQGLHGQGERNHITPCAVAMSGHVRLFVEHGVVRLLSVLALHGHHNQAGEARGRASQLHDRDVFFIDSAQAIARPHVVRVAQWWELGFFQVVKAIGADRHLALLAEGDLAFSVRLAAPMVLQSMHGARVCMCKFWVLFRNNVYVRVPIPSAFACKSP